MATGNTNINMSIDQILESLPVGSISKAIGNNLYGIDFRQTGNAVPRSKDSVGFTFFTRPQLNLTTVNVSNFRGFYSLLTNNELSYQRYTRMMLDPRMGYGDGMKCPFVDNMNPFISILTNNIMSVSGWPDLTVPTHTSESGLYGEELSMVDGVTNHFESYDLDVTFKNTKGNPLYYMFYVWIKYQSLVFEGILNPYLDMITENEIDYNTRIYRIVLDQQKRYVTYIASTGASFPINVPTGGLFDYNRDTPFNTKNSEVNIRFKCDGFIAFEDMLKLQFNRTLAIFNPYMKKILDFDMGNAPVDQRSRENPTVVYRIPGTPYIKIPHQLAMSTDLDITGGGYYSVNHYALPYINLETNELEFWIDERYFKRATESAFKNMLEQPNKTDENEEIGD